VQNSATEKMSGTKTSPAAQSPLPERKRKAVSAEIEIDVDAPEPTSKKASRKAKRAKTDVGSQPIAVNDVHEDTSKSTGRSPYGIWIGNLHFSTTKAELQDFLTSDTEFPISADQITRVHLPTSGSKSGPQAQNKGFAYIDFSDSDAQTAAVQLGEKLLGGRRVLIKGSRDFEGRPERSGGEEQEQQQAPSKRVFVGNLGFETTKETLQEHFNVCGPIGNVHVAAFEDSGKCKGYAWIDFEQTASAAAAVRGWAEVDSSQQTESSKKVKRRVWVGKIEGRKLRMEFAEDKSVRYKKRFGKGAQDAKQAVSRKPALSSQRENLSGLKGTDNSKAGTSTQIVEGGVSERRPDPAARYSASTVAKLTGAIVGSQGKKTKFN
jgi:RNA recognition motif-containing protein